MLTDAVYSVRAALLQNAVWLPCSDKIMGPITVLIVVFWSEFWCSAMVLNLDSGVPLTVLILDISFI